MLVTQPSDSSTKHNAEKKQPAAHKTKDGSKKEKKGRKKGNTIILILIILILSLIIAFGAIFLFNFAGLKAETSKWLSNLPVVGKLIKPVVEDKTPEQIAWEEIELERTNLAIREKELNELGKELEEREKVIASKEKGLEDKELQLNEMLQKLSDKLLSVQEQIEYLEKIENSKAVEILLSMEDKATVVQILRNMKKEKASSILALMDPLQAAQILEELAEPQTIKNN